MVRKNNNTKILQEKQTPVPNFTVEYSNKKWCEHKPEVLQINSAEEDAPYLKYLLSTASAMGIIRKGLFIPTGIHLMQGKEVMTSILKDQEEYVKSTIGIPITGVTDDSIYQISKEGKQSIHKTLMDTHLVKSIESTNQTNSTGKWIIITKITTKHRC